VALVLGSACGARIGRRLITATGVCVVAVDVGSVRPPSKFAWVASDVPGRDLVSSDTDPESAVSALVEGLLAGAQAVLLLEAPMSVLVPGGQPDV
jgi:hypothetical protein